MTSHKKFLTLEIKYKLFNLKNELNDYYWDFIRYPLSFRIFINHSKDLKFSIQTKSIIFFNLLKDIFILLSTFLNKKKYILIYAHKNNLVKKYETTLGKQNCLMINIKNEKKIYFDEITNSFVSVINKLNFSLKKKNIKPFNLNKVFGKGVNNTADKLLIKHYNEEIFFKFIFKLIKPKSIFFLNAGNKSVITAAKKTNTKIFEIQHAEISPMSILNHYPKNIDHKKIYYPDKFFLFSKFWDCINYKTDKIIIGANKKKEKKNFKKNNFKNIVFAMNLVNETYFCDIIKKITNKLNNNIKIFIKPHPMFPHKEDDYKKIFKKNQKVEIINSNNTFDEVLVYSSIIVTSYSSVIFEGLQSNKIIALDCYSYPLYGQKISNFDHSNLYYFKNSNELLNIFTKKLKKNKVKFYEKFNEKKLKKYV